MCRPGSELSDWGQDESYGSTSSVPLNETVKEAAELLVPVIVTAKSPEYSMNSPAANSAFTFTG